MAETQPPVPHQEQDVQEVAALVSALETAATGKKGAFTCKKSRYAVDGSPTGAQVDSWKFQDWDYKRRDLPTYARGLFTSRDERGQPYIAVRGYDKFFNTGEVDNTKWAAIEERTRGPYELTLKENGCIIFISALADDTLLVCSKHSTGARGDVDLSHSSAGEKHLLRQLAQLGKTKADLARELRARNATAVAELCDDAFEEHILAYGPDKAGLYLHGLNLNLPTFTTYPSVHVQAFARAWGFLPTELKVLDTVAEVRAFLEATAETGAHAGRDVEGFVVRCQMSPSPGTRPFQDWFFKYKFEEPYLMYRQWRECTNAIISGKPPRYKKHAAITAEYLLFARKRLAADPKLGKLYARNHGIIRLRDEFLAFKNLKGTDAANFEALYGDGAPAEVARDVILVPISTLGCGKTTLAVALARLFGFGHVQNDNITGSKRPPRFTRQVLEQLATHPGVVADRNNAQRHERQQILTDVRQQHLGATLVALNFVHDDKAAVRAVTTARVYARGDNHQTIRAQTERSKVTGIMDNFLHRFEPLNTERSPDDGFDAVIDLNPVDGSRANVEKVARKLHELYPRLVAAVPSAEALDAAVAYAIDEYRPPVTHTVVDRSRTQQTQQTKPTQTKQTQQAKPKAKPLEYMAVHVPTEAVLEPLEATLAPLPAADTQLYRTLKETRRLPSAFHVTLMHRAGASQDPALWERYSKMHADALAADPGTSTPELGRVEVHLERVVYDDRLVALVVRLVDATGCWTCVNSVAHITAGTRDSSVKPKESNELLARWLDEGATPQNKIHAVVVAGQPVLPGVVRGVLSR